MVLDAEMAGAGAGRGEPWRGTGLGESLVRPLLWERVPSAGEKCEQNLRTTNDFVQGVPSGGA